jgi:hypothetical protein
MKNGSNIERNRLAGRRLGGYLGGDMDNALDTPLYQMGAFPTNRYDPDLQNSRPSDSR